MHCNVMCNQIVAHYVDAVAMSAPVTIRACSEMQRARIILLLQGF